jgi:hypothetical protein
MKKHRKLKREIKRQMEQKRKRIKVKVLEE